jgi:hypothetical protein
VPFPRKPPLTVPLILGWIDAHQRRTGEWPTAQSGPVAGGYLGDNWRRIDNVLTRGRARAFGGRIRFPL